jgi:tetratricopeptide (TPR) repeat protein
MVDMGRYEEAEEMYLQLMKSLELSLGKNHPTSHECYVGYENLLRMTGRYKEALLLFETTYIAYCELLGPPHPRTLHLAGLLNDLMKDIEKKNQENG